MSPLPPALTDRLIDIASGEHAVATYLERRSLVGLLEVPETALAATASVVPAEATAEVCVVAASGAGSLVALARRSLDRVEVRAVRTALRDLDDLAGNAARVVAAARELPQEIVVRVGLPDVPGWLAAAEEIEAAGLEAAIEAGERVESFAAQLSALIELDLPFTLSRNSYPVQAVLSAVDLLIDGAETAEVCGLLTDTAQRERAWDEVGSQRVRRRLRAVAVEDPDAALRQLGLLS